MVYRLITSNSSYSSSQPVSVSQWHAHSTVVVFHTMHRGLRDTRLFLYLVSVAALYSLLMSQPRSLPLFLLSLCHTIPVCFLRRLCCLPCPCQVKSRLLPPPKPHPCPWCPLRLPTQFIDTQSLLDLCEEKERTPGARVGVWWWEQAVFDLAGARETTSSAEEADGEGM